MKKPFGDSSNGFHTGEEMPWTGNLDKTRKPRPELEALEQKYGMEIEIASPVVEKLLELGDKLHWKIIDPRETLNNPKASIVDDVVLIYLKNNDEESPISMFGIKKNQGEGHRYKHRMVVIDTENIKSAQGSVIVRMNNTDYHVGFQSIIRGAKSSFRN